MKTKSFRIISILMVVVLLLVLGTVFAGAIAKSNLAKKYPAPGQLVDVGGYKMHINCVGQGSPTIILAAGMSDFSLIWAYVQPEVGKFTRVCAYDRAGLGWSEPSHLPRTANTLVAELHTLLVNANIPGPYVLVGHSMGGMLVRVYAHNYPDEVAGMVLVDSAHEEGYIRIPYLTKVDQIMTRQHRMFAFLSSTGLMALAPQNVPNPGLPDDVYAHYQAILATSSYFETNIEETNALEESYTEVGALHITSFGDLPLIVLRRGRWDVIPFFSDFENQRAWDVSQELQSELAALSSEGQLIVAEQSGHTIQIDQPDLVIDAVREIVDVIRN